MLSKKTQRLSCVWADLTAECESIPASLLGEVLSNSAGDADIGGPRIAPQSPRGTQVGGELELVASVASWKEFNKFRGTSLCSFNLLGT